MVPDSVKRDLCGTLLVDLPPELLTTICVFVGCPTVVWCRLVCRRLRDVIDASLELQYRSELVRDGMVDGGLARVGLTHPTTTHWHPHLTTSDRLARLRQLRKAWQTLNWTRCVTVPMPGPCCAYELVGGVFCKTQPATQKGRGGGGGGLEWPWLVAGDGHMHGDDEEQEMGHVLGSRSMSATWLPGTHTPSHSVVRDDLGIPTRDFAMDPSQDLLVLLKGGEDHELPMAVVFPGVLELHVRTMSTNQTHPEARVPVLCAPVLYPVTSVLVQIVDDVVGMMYCVDPSRPRITIWNWKTGHLVVDRASGNLPPGTWDFSFIHSRAFFVTTGNGSGSLELFTFTCSPTDASANFPPPFLSRSPQLEPTHFIHVATLRLPPIQPFARMLSVTTHTGPFLAACPPGAPFVSSNADRIHVLTIQYVHLPTLNGQRMRPRVGVIVHQRGLEEYLQVGAALKSVVGPNAGAMEVHWSEWGRKHARMLSHMGTFQWLRYVHGQRFVTLLPSSEVGKSTLKVLDFNVRRAFDNDTDNGNGANNARDGNEKSDEEDTDKLLIKTAREHVDYPTRLTMPNVFVTAVESGLPYHEARRDIWGDYSGVMIDDERLVCLKYPASLTGDMREIDVFTM